LFDISFNQPTDYDFNTGIMNVNAKNTGQNGPFAGMPQQNYTYVATRCKSMFSKGAFKQQLEGKLKVESARSGNANNNIANGRINSAIGAVAGAVGNAVGGAINNLFGSRSPASDISAGALGLQRFDDGSTLQTFDDGSTLATGTDGSISASPSQDTQPANPPGEPTSDGDITGVTDNPAPPDAGGGGNEVATPPQSIVNDDA
jgi:hypothetical protein